MGAHNLKSINSMKNVILLVGTVLSLTLFSFDDVQERKVVKLRNGNYQAMNLEMDFQEVLKKMNVDGWKEKMVFTQQANKIDLSGEIVDLSELRGVDGWKETIAVHKTSKTGAFHEEAAKNVFSKTLWRDKGFMVDDLERHQAMIDETMESFR